MLASDGLGFCLIVFEVTHYPLSEGCVIDWVGSSLLWCLLFSQVDLAKLKDLIN